MGKSEAIEELEGSARIEDLMEALAVHNVHLQQAAM